MANTILAENLVLYSLRTLDSRGAEWCDACSPWLTEKTLGVLDKSGGAQRRVYRHFYSGRETKGTTASTR